MTKLLIVESPAKAKTITKYLGKEYKVLASCGHVRGIPSKSNAVDTEKEFEVTYEVNDGSEKYIKNIMDAAKTCDEIYMATDLDREGEAISWHVAEILHTNKANIDKKLQRIVFNEITPKAIKLALTKPRPINMDLVRAQQARQTLDYLVGFNISPVLWRKLPGSKSAGRVQSVALRILCEREQEVIQFRPHDYWTIHSNFENEKKSVLKSDLFEVNGHKVEKFESEEVSNNIINIAQQLTYKVESVIQKDTTRTPDAPFITSTLIQSGSTTLKMPAKKIMQIAQKLYEGIDFDGKRIGLITYMRTDSVSVAPEAIESARGFIEKKYGKDYLPATPRVFKSKVKNAQEAHEAIRPTDPTITPDSLKDSLASDELRLYELIWSKFIACQMAAAKIAKTTVHIAGKGKVNDKEILKSFKDAKIAGKNDEFEITFKVIGTVVTFDGFYILSGRNTDRDDELPPIKEGEILNAEEILSKKHTTVAPARYSEASLVKKMEELGIGRPSTYATIITILQERKYAFIEKSRFFVEDRGQLVNAFLTNFFEKYVEYDFTASLERQLDDISEGKNTYLETLKNFWSPFKENVDKILQVQNSDVLENIENTLERFIFKINEENNTAERKCPKCKEGQLKLKNSKYSPFIGCSKYPECDYAAKFVLNREKSEEIEVPEQDQPKMQHSGNLKTIMEHENETIILNKGQYGHYLSLCRDEKVVKNISLSAGISIDNMELTVEQAKKLFEMPFVVGKYPDTKEEIKVGIGRYGPYIIYKKKFISIKDRNEIAAILDFSLDDAVALINSSRK